MEPEACWLLIPLPLAKYTVDDLEDNGKIVGTLGAANTIGSIIGTFLPTFDPLLPEDNYRWILLQMLILFPKKQNCCYALKNSTGETQRH